MLRGSAIERDASHVNDAATARPCSRIVRQGFAARPRGVWSNDRHVYAQPPLPATCEQTSLTAFAAFALIASPCVSDPPSNAAQNARDNPAKAQSVDDASHESAAQNAHDDSFAAQDSGVQSRRAAGRRKRDSTRPRRAYNIKQALETRRRNEQLRREGKTPPPPYVPRGGLDRKRKYERTGRYRGATLQHGGKLRAFSEQNAPFYAQSSSRFCALSNSHIDEAMLSEKPFAMAPFSVGVLPPSEKVSLYACSSEPHALCVTPSAASPVERFTC